MGKGCRAAGEQVHRQPQRGVQVEQGPGPHVHKAGKGILWPQPLHSGEWPGKAAMWKGQRACGDLGV